MKKAILLIVILLSTLFYAIFNSFELIGFNDTNGFVLTGDDIQANLYRNVRDTVVPESIDGGEGIYKRWNTVYYGDNRKIKVNENYPIFLKDEKTIKLQTGNETLFDSELNALNSFSGIYIVDGKAYNLDFHLADYNNYILIKLFNGLFVNAVDMEIETELNKYSIKANTMMYFQEDNIDLYRLSVEQFVGGEVPNLSLDSVVRFKDVELTYGELLFKIGAISETALSQDDKANEENGFEDIIKNIDAIENGEVDDKNKNDVFKDDIQNVSSNDLKPVDLPEANPDAESPERKDEAEHFEPDEDLVVNNWEQPIVTFGKTLSTGAYSLSFSLNIIDNMNTIYNGIVVEAVEVDTNKIYTKDTIEVNGTEKEKVVFLTNLKPETNYYLRIHYRYSDEYKKLGKKYVVSNDNSIANKIIYYVDGNDYTLDHDTHVYVPYDGYFDSDVNLFKDGEMKFTTLSVSDLKDISFGPMVPLKAQSKTVGVDNIYFINDNNIDSIGAVARVQVRIRSDEERKKDKPGKIYENIFDDPEIIKLRSFNSLIYTSPSVLKTKTTYYLDFTCFDRFGNEIKTNNNTVTVATCSILPKVIYNYGNYSDGSGNIAFDKLYFDFTQIQNSDYLDYQDMKLSIYEIVRDENNEIVSKKLAPLDYSNGQNIIEGKKIIVDGFELGKEYQAEITCLADINDGDGVTEKVLKNETIFIRELSAYGNLYVDVYNDSVDIIPKELERRAVFSIYVDDEQTNENLLPLITEYNITITDITNRDFSYSYTLLPNELKQFLIDRDDENQHIPFIIDTDKIVPGGLKSVTDYQITFTAFGQSSNQKENVTVISKNTRFKTGRKIPTVELANVEGYTGYLRFDVIIDDPDDFIDGNYVTVEVNEVNNITAEQVYFATFIVEKNQKKYYEIYMYNDADYSFDGNAYDVKGDTDYIIRIISDKVSTYAGSVSTYELASKTVRTKIGLDGSVDLQSLIEYESFVALPDGLVQIEYAVQIPASSFIIDYAPKPDDNYDIELSYKIANISNAIRDERPNTYFFGYDNGSNNRFLLSSIFSNDSSTYYDSSLYATYGENTNIRFDGDFNKHIINISPKDVIFDGITYRFNDIDIANTTYDPNNKIGVGTYYATDTGGLALDNDTTIQWYHINISTDNKIIAQLVPCYTNEAYADSKGEIHENGAVGLYDIVSDIFYEISTPDAVKNETVLEQYKFVDYIEYNGKQLVDLNFNMNTSIYDYEAIVTLKALKPNYKMLVFGSGRDGSNEVSFELNSQNNLIVTDALSTTITKINRNPTEKLVYEIATDRGNEQYNIKVHRPDDEYDVDSAIVPMSLYNSSTIKLFDYDVTDDDISSNVDLYGALFKRDGVTIRDLRPAVRSSDGVPGLFDIINYIFYENDANDDPTLKSTLTRGDIVNIPVNRTTRKYDKYVVLRPDSSEDNKKNGMYLFSRDSAGTCKYRLNTNIKRGTWRKSNAINWCSDYYSNTISSSIKSAIMRSYGSQLDGDRVYFLTKSQIRDEMTKDEKAVGFRWWWRADASTTRWCCYVNSDGSFGSYYVFTNSFNCRPGLSLDKTQIYFKLNEDEGDGSYDVIFRKNITKTYFGFGSEITDTDDYVLPASYQKLDYLENTDGAYIDTEYAITSNQFGIECKFEQNENGSIVGSGQYFDEQLVDGETLPAKYNYLFNINDGHVITDEGQLKANSYATSTIPYTYSYNAINTVSYHYKFGDIIYKFNNGQEQVITGSDNEITRSGHLYVFANSLLNGEDVSAKNNTLGKIYYLKIYDNGLLQRSFVPAMKTSDRSIGLFDLVEKKFYPLYQDSILSGLATLPARYNRLDYIDLNGAGRFDLYTDFQSLPTGGYELSMQVKCTDTNQFFIGQYYGTKDYSGDYTIGTAMDDENKIHVYYGKKEFITDNTYKYGDDLIIRNNYLNDRNISINGEVIGTLDPYTSGNPNSVLTAGISVGATDTNGYCPKMAYYVDRQAFKDSKPGAAPNKFLFSVMRLYYVVITDKDGIRKYFVPVYDTTNKVSGLYNLGGEVTGSQNKFYAYQGFSGTVDNNDLTTAIGSGRTNLPEEYTRIDYIETDGTQYIDIDLPQYAANGDKNYLAAAHFEVIDKLSSPIFGGNTFSQALYGDGSYVFSSYSTPATLNPNGEVVSIVSGDGQGRYASNNVYRYSLKTSPNHLLVNASYYSPCSGDVNQNRISLNGSELTEKNSFANDFDINTASSSKYYIFAAYDTAKSQVIPYGGRARCYGVTMFYFADSTYRWTKRNLVPVLLNKSVVDHFGDIQVAGTTGLFDYISCDFYPFANNADIIRGNDVDTGSPSEMKATISLTINDSTEALIDKTIYVDVYNKGVSSLPIATLLFTYTGTGTIDVPISFDYDVLKSDNPLDYYEFRLYYYTDAGAKMPLDVETFSTDDAIYTINSFSELMGIGSSSRKYVVTSDISCEIPETLQNGVVFPEQYLNAKIDFQGHLLEMDCHGISLFDIISKDAYIKNLNLVVAANPTHAFYEDYEYAPSLCKTNYGTISDIFVTYTEYGPRIAREEGRSDGYSYVRTNYKCAYYWVLDGKSTSYYRNDGIIARTNEESGVIERFVVKCASELNDCQHSSLVSNNNKGTIRIGYIYGNDENSKALIQLYSGPDFRLSTATTSIEYVVPMNRYMLDSNYGIIANNTADTAKLYDVYALATINYDRATFNNDNSSQAATGGYPVRDCFIKRIYTSLDDRYGTIIDGGKVGIISGMNTAGVVSNTIAYGDTLRRNASTRRDDNYTPFTTANSVIMPEVGPGIGYNTSSVNSEKNYYISSIFNTYDTKYSTKGEISNLLDYSFVDGTLNYYESEYIGGFDVTNAIAKNAYPSVIFESQFMPEQEIIPIATSNKVEDLAIVQSNIYTVTKNQALDSLLFNAAHITYNDVGNYLTLSGDSYVSKHQFASLVISNPNLIPIDSIITEDDKMICKVIYQTNDERAKTSTVYLDIYNPSKALTSYKINDIVYIDSSTSNSVKVFAGGSGYYISTPFFKPLTANTWSSINDSLDENFYLSQDLDFTGYRTKEIFINGTYRGQLDGNNMTIKNVDIKQDDSSVTKFAIFKELNGAIIKNIVIDKAHVLGGQESGILASSINNTTISNVFITNSYVEGVNRVGSIAANATSSVIEKSGIDKVKIVHMGANGINSTTNYIGGAGGLVGVSSGRTSYTRTFANNVYLESFPSGYGNYFVGGLIGNIQNGIGEEVVGSYATGVINTSATSGGLIGAGSGKFDVTNCYSDVDVNTYSYRAGGLIGIVNGGGKFISNVVFGDVTLVTDCDNPNILSTLSYDSNVNVGAVISRTARLNGVTYDGENSFDNNCISNNDLYVYLSREYFTIAKRSLDGMLPKVCDELYLELSHQTDVFINTTDDASTYITGITVGDSSDDNKLITVSVVANIDEQPIKVYTDYSYVDKMIGYNNGINSLTKQKNIVGATGSMIIIQKQRFVTKELYISEYDIEGAYDKYFVTAIEYIDKDGNSQFIRVNEQLDIGKQFNEISNMTDWKNKVSSSIAQNFMITGDIDFNSAIYTPYGESDVNLVINRLVGSKGNEDNYLDASSYNIIKNLNVVDDSIENSARTMYISDFGFIRSILNECRNIAFDNISIEGSTSGAIIGQLNNEGKGIIFNNCSIKTKNASISNNTKLSGTGLIGSLKGNLSYTSVLNTHLDDINTSNAGILIGRMNAESFNTSLHDICVKDSSIKNKYSNTGGIVGSVDFVFETRISNDLCFKDIMLNNVSISASESVGGVIGLSDMNSSFSLDNITVNSSTINGVAYIGGLIGDNKSNNSVVNSPYIYKCTVKGESYVGGICGYERLDVHNPIVDNSLIISTKSFIGGIIGSQIESGTRSGESFVQRNISIDDNADLSGFILNTRIYGNSFVGGYAGSVADDIERVIIRNCEVKGNSNIGGVTSDATNKLIKDAYVSNSLIVGWSNKTESSQYDVPYTYASANIGGILGGNGIVQNALVDNCIVGNNSFNNAGGIIGLASDKESLRSSNNAACENTIVVGNGNVGGIAGLISSTVTSDYAIGNMSSNAYVIGKRNVGGIAGQISSISVSSSNEVCGTIQRRSTPLVVNAIFTGTLSSATNVGAIYGTVSTSLDGDALISMPEFVSVTSLPSSIRGTSNYPIFVETSTAGNIKQSYLHNSITPIAINLLNETVIYNDSKYTTEDMESLLNNDELLKPYVASYKDIKTQYDVGSDRITDTPFIGLTNISSLKMNDYQYLTVNPSQIYFKDGNKFAAMGDGSNFDLMPLFTKSNSASSSDVLFFDSNNGLSYTFRQNPFTQKENIITDVKQGIGIPGTLVYDDEKALMDNIYNSYKSGDYANASIGVYDDNSSSDSNSKYIYAYASGINLLNIDFTDDFYNDFAVDSNKEARISLTTGMASDTLNDTVIDRRTITVSYNFNKTMDVRLTLVDKKTGNIIKDVSCSIYPNDVSSKFGNVESNGNEAIIYIYNNNLKAFLPYMPVNKLNSVPGATNIINIYGNLIMNSNGSIYLTSINSMNKIQISNYTGARIENECQLQNNSLPLYTFNYLGKTIYTFGSYSVVGLSDSLSLTNDYRLFMVNDNLLLVNNSTHTVSDPIYAHEYNDGFGAFALRGNGTLISLTSYSPLTTILKDIKQTNIVQLSHSLDPNYRGVGFLYSDGSMSFFDTTINAIYNEEPINNDSRTNVAYDPFKAFASFINNAFSLSNDTIDDLSNKKESADRLADSLNKSNVGVDDLIDYLNENNENTDKVADAMTKNGLMPFNNDTKDSSITNDQNTNIEKTLDSYMLPKIDESNIASSSNFVTDHSNEIEKHNYVSVYNDETGDFDLVDANELISDPENAKEPIKAKDRTRLEALYSRMSKEKKEKQPNGWIIYAALVLAIGLLLASILRIRKNKQSS